MSTWDWQVFCKDTITGDVQPRCFGQGGDITYLDWLLSAWGWTLSVALLALVVALIVGAIIGICRTLPDKRLVWLGNVWTGRATASQMRIDLSGMDVIKLVILSRRLNLPRGAGGCGEEPLRTRQLLPGLARRLLEKAS